MIRKTHLRVVFVAALMAWLALPVPPAMAQSALPEAPPPVVLTLEEALQIALVKNYAIRESRLDMATASAQVREAWGEVLPKVDLNSSYTRNVKTANPFAGSQAGGLFATLGFLDWLAYNEEARTDDDPNSLPISLDEYFDRRSGGLEEAGIRLDNSDNPFNVPNQFQNGITVSQTLFSGSAFAAIAGARRLKELNEEAMNRQEQLVLDQVRQAFYQALLAEEQTQVMIQSVARTFYTLEETAKRVALGNAPKFQRLTAEVELANLQTQLVQTQNQAATTLDNLKFLLDIPIDQPVQLRGKLEAGDHFQHLQVVLGDSYDQALARRPDLRQAQLALELQKINKGITRSNYYPTLKAFANFNYTGTVPDNRTVVLTDENDPFKFSSRENDFFSSSYWQESINVGFQLSWNLFNGFQTRSRVQQQQIELDRIQLTYDQLKASILLEVKTARQNLEAAFQRIISQERNVERAELNYQYASTRLGEGVASPLEERNASEQLDQSRIHYLQAVYDYLVARSHYETATGQPLTLKQNLKLTNTSN